MKHEHTKAIVSPPLSHCMLSRSDWETISLLSHDVMSLEAHEY